MQAHDLYKDISERTQGDVYIGIVGPVRTGKSTFINRFMEKMVIPAIENAHVRSRTLDELPQSGSGKTVMTTQPAFVPNEAVQVALPGDHPVRFRLIDCVGYMVDGALGTQDGEGLRMVKTPWADKEIPFEQAAEIGTKKVIDEHSTIGLVITTDGSVTDLPRTAYASAEARIIDELKTIGKPFAVILNTANPNDKNTETLRKNLENNYQIPVISLNAAEIEESDIKKVLETVLNQFPVIQLNLQTPEWVNALDDSHWLLQSLMHTIEESTPDSLKMGQSSSFSDALLANAYISETIQKLHLHGSGELKLQIMLKEGLFNQILAEQCGTEIKNDAHLLSLLCELVNAKREYDHVAQAIESVRRTGYGLVPPKIEELTFQEPEIMKQGGHFGVKLRASAPSLHMIRVDIQTEVSPIVGTE